LPRNRGYAFDLGIEQDLFPYFSVDSAARKAGEAKIIEGKTQSALAATLRIVDLSPNPSLQAGLEFRDSLRGRCSNTQGASGIVMVGLLFFPTWLEQAEGEFDSSRPEHTHMLVWGTAEIAPWGRLTDEGLSHYVKSLGPGPDT
jgi:hypothetical protein